MIHFLHNDTNNAKILVVTVQATLCIPHLTSIDHGHISRKSNPFRCLTKMAAPRQIMACILPKRAIESRWRDLWASLPLKSDCSVAFTWRSCVFLWIMDEINSAFAHVDLLEGGIGDYRAEIAHHPKPDRFSNQKNITSGRGVKSLDN